MSRATGRHTRPKKLNSKQNVQIFREDQVDSLADYDTQRSTIETGVEKAEESVCLHPFDGPDHHLLFHFSFISSSLCPLLLLSHHDILAKHLEDSLAVLFCSPD